MSTSLTIDVVIPTYDGWAMLRRCLDHLRHQTAAHRVIVSDDASSDGTPDLLGKVYPEVSVVVAESNRGFSATVNAGIAAGTGEIVVVLNNDVECRPDFLERIAAPLVEDPEVGLVAALLLKADGGSIDSMGLEVDFTLAPFPRLWGAPAAAAGRDTDGLLGPVGGAAAYRRAALNEAGTFDESIFGYGEDVDLALRLRRAGWRIAAAPGAVGVHLGSATFGSHSPKQVYHRGWSRAYLLRKYGVLRRPRALAHAVLAEGGSVAWQLVSTREPAGLRGRVAGWRAASREMDVPSGCVNTGLGLRETIRRRRAYRGG